MLPMKKLIFLTTICSSFSSLNAQKVYSVKYQSQADLKVFVVKYESQADLKVYKVDYESQAGWKNSSKKQLLY